MSNEDRDGMDQLREMAQQIADGARGRGREQGAAFLAFLEREISEDFDAVNDEFDRDLARRALYMFTLGLLEVVEESGRVDVDLAVMAAQEAVDEVDQDGVSFEYHDEPYAIELEGDSGDEDDDEGAGTIGEAMDELRAKAAALGATLCEDIHGVTCVVTASGEWHIGFQTPDQHCGLDEYEGAHSIHLRGGYLHWYVDHFLAMLASCTGETAERSGGVRSVVGVFNALQFYEARLERDESEDEQVTAVPPVKINEGFVEVSQHLENASSAKPVGSRYYQVRHGGGNVFCGILELFDAEGEATEQLNLFAFPDLTDPAGAVFVKMVDRINSLANRVAQERGAPITVREVVDMAMCQRHRMLMAPLPPDMSQNARASNKGNLH